MQFTKMHGAGNDYVYIDARYLERDWPALAVSMSDRHTGVGSDGIILLASSEGADLRMRMYNADGSEGEMCGNGIRCLVKFAVDKGFVPNDRSPVSVETLAGVRQVTPKWDRGEMVRARVGKVTIIPGGKYLYFPVEPWLYWFPWSLFFPPLPSWSCPPANMRKPVGPKLQQAVAAENKGRDHPALVGMYRR